MNDKGKLEKPTPAVGQQWEDKFGKYEITRVAEGGQVFVRRAGYDRDTFFYVGMMENDVYLGSQPNTEKLGERPGKLAKGQRWSELAFGGREWVVTKVRDGGDFAEVRAVDIGVESTIGLAWIHDPKRSAYLGTTEEPAKPAEPAAPNGCTCKATPCDYLCPSAGATMVVIDETAKFGPEEWKAMEKLLPPAASPALPPKREAPPRREVSHNGSPGSWVNYDSLIDADPWDAYKHRREVFADGRITLHTPWMPMLRTVGVYGKRTCGPEYCDFSAPRSEFQRAERKPLGLLTEWDCLPGVE